MHGGPAALTVPISTLPRGEGLPLPAYQTAGAAGADLVAALDDAVPGVVDGALTLAPGAWAVVPCGFAMALPEGWEAQVRPRSGLAARFGVTVLNAPGTIDSDYRGEVAVPLINHGRAPFVIRRGDRIAQMVIAPVTRAVWAPVEGGLSATARGGAGFGSTGV